MKVQRIIGVTLFLLGLGLGLISDLFAADPQIQAWYAAYRPWILGTGILFVLLGIALTIASIRSDAPEAAMHDRIGSSRPDEPSHSVDLDQDDEFLRSQLGQHRQNLHRLLEQKAIYGNGEEPLRLLNQIEVEQQAIKEIQRKLQR